MAFLCRQRRRLLRSQGKIGCFAALTADHFFPQGDEEFAQPSELQGTDAETMSAIVRYAEDCWISQMIGLCQVLPRMSRLRNNTPFLMTLVELQGLAVPCDGDIMSVQLKPHQCWRKMPQDGLGLQSRTMRSRKILWTESSHLWLQESMKGRRKNQLRQTLTILNQL